MLPLLLCLLWLGPALSEPGSVVPLGGAPDLCQDPACKCESLTVVCQFGKRNIAITTDSFLNYQKDIRELHLSGANGLIVEENSLSLMKTLEVIVINNTGSVKFEKNACSGLEPVHLKLLISNCGSVQFKTASFDVKGPMTINISTCADLMLQKKSFSRVTSLNLSAINNISLDEETFYMEKNEPKKGKIHFQDVIILNIPKNTFKTSLLEVKILNSTINRIHSGAFSASEYAQISIIHSVIKLIKRQGFSDKSLIHNTTIKGSKIENMEEEAFAASSTDLQLKHSIFQNMSKNAIKSNNANIDIHDNIFFNVGIELNKWNNLRIERNLFMNIEKNSIVTPHMDNSEPSIFTFIGNKINLVELGGLKFIKDLPGKLSLHVDYENNTFTKNCVCNVNQWLENVLGGNVTSMKEYLEQSACCLDDRSCYNLNDKITIDKNSKILCGNQELHKKSSQKVSSNNSFSNYGSEFFEDNATEGNLLNDPTKLIIYTLIALVICGSIIFGTVAICKIAKRRGYCVNVKSAVTTSDTSCAAFFDRIFGLNYGLDTAGSINRISINEYTENHILQERAPLNDNDSIQFENNILDTVVDTMDRATQTLPEELTKELLESLREKLEDPENYNEARETIEHLYDLIKVEEYCNMNNNNDNFSSVPLNDKKDTENLYDVILLPIHLHNTGKKKKNMVSVGTSTRESPVNRTSQISPYNKQTALCHEYSEPKDRTTNLYSELDTKYKGSQSDMIEGILRPTPLNFLRAIEMSIKNSKPSSNDSQTPSCSMKDNLLPGPSGLSVKSATQKSNKSNFSNASDSSASKMANRPLPEKPRIPP